MARRTHSPRESRSIETTGRTIDDAVAKASTQLKVSEHDLDIKVLDEGRAGFLGIGSKEAKIRATVKGGGGALPDLGTRPPRSGPRRSSRVEEDASGPAKRDERVPSSEGDTGDSRRRRSRRGRGGEGDEGNGRSGGRDNREGGRERRERRPSSERSGGGRGRRDSSRLGSGEPAQPDAGFEARAKEFLSGILQRMGFPSAVESHFDDGAYLLTIQGGEDEAVLIGRKGETLDALQHIVYKTVSRGREDSLSVRIDVAGYRERRDEALAEEARELAQQVLREGRSQQTEPLRPAERRIVHRTVTEMEGVTSRAIGNGVVKRILIEVEGSAPQEAMEPTGRSEGAYRSPEPRSTTPRPAEARPTPPSRPASRPAPSSASSGEVLDYVSSEPASNNQNDKSETGKPEWGRKSRPSKKLRGRR